MCVCDCVRVCVYDLCDCVCVCMCVCVCSKRDSLAAKNDCSTPLVRSMVKYFLHHKCRALNSISICSVCVLSGWKNEANEWI